VANLRGFTTKEEHDAEIIKRWNHVVKPEDTVWHLGDVGMGKLERFIQQLSELNGTIHLITGNHDEVFPGTRDSWKRQILWMGSFTSVQAYARRKVGSYTFLLSHFPYTRDHGEERYTQYRFRDEGMWLVHGHLHQKVKVGRMFHQPATFGRPGKLVNRQLHVGLDAWDYTPVSQEDVIVEMAKAELVDG
jgi:calcineurin-like phosphoesterase family protein